MSSEDYQANFLSFMLGNTAAPSTPKQSTTQLIATPTKSPYEKKTEKQYWTIVKAFQGTLQRDWLEVDDNLAAVMRSISNLRDRIYWSSKAQQQQQLDKHKTVNPEVHDSWKVPRGAQVHLTRPDMELALTHELQQHEQMMAGARSLLFSLNQAQEALGRRLSEAMHFDLEVQEEYYSWDEPPPPDSSTINIITALEQVYHSLASELYRKQILVQDVLNCTNDFLLASDDIAVTEEDHPRRVAHKCCDKWSLLSQQTGVRELLAL